MKATKIQPKQGFTLTEVMVSVGVLFVLFGCFGMSLGGFQRLNHYYMSKQRCTAAAQAQIENIAASGKAIDQKVCKELWPTVSISIERSAGTGQWKGLTLIKATAKTKTRGQQVSVVLARYINTSGKKK